MLEQCLDWESNGDSEEASYGTKIHHLIDCVANGKAMECSLDDLAVAEKAYKWLMSLGDLRWNHEHRVEGAVPETGGTIDAFSKDYANRRLIIVDWKGSLPAADSCQGKAYALNLWTAMPIDEAARFDSVHVIFYNYMDGSTCGAEYTSAKTLVSDIRALIRRHSGQMGQRRTASKACMYCKHAGSCATAAPETKNALVMLESLCTDLTIESTLDMHTKLSEVMKRAEKIQAALKDRLMTAARAGELPGYTVKTKRGSQQSWANEAESLTHVQAILSANFADAKVTGLLPPKQVKDAVKAALGVSYSSAVDDAISAGIVSNSYEYLAKDSTSA